MTPDRAQEIVEELHFKLCPEARPSRAVMKDVRKCEHYQTILVALRAYAAEVERRVWTEAARLLGERTDAIQRAEAWSDLLTEFRRRAARETEK